VLPKLHCMDVSRAGTCAPADTIVRTCTAIGLTNRETEFCLIAKKLTTAIWPEPTNAARHPPCLPKGAIPKTTVVEGQFS
jgi:hypothetical protein